MTMRILTCTLSCILAVAAAAAGQGAKPAPAAASRDANLEAYVQLLRSDLRANKSALIADVMQFTEAEDKAFWPVYRDYEKALAALNDDRQKLVLDYAATGGLVSDDVADRTVKGAFALDARRHTLLASYYENLKKAMPAKTAARVVQVEHQFLLLLDLQIASALPIAQ
jgi:hypothetical protein